VHNLRITGCIYCRIALQPPNMPYMLIAAAGSIQIQGLRPLQSKFQSHPISYWDTNCHKQTESDFVVFSRTEKEFTEFKDIDIAVTDAALGIRFTDTTIRDDTLLILRYNCPDPKCDVACLGWGDLYYHVQRAHQKVMCNLCTQYKKVFTHEHDLFTPKQLRQHQEHGDDKPGAIDQSGFKGHPKCGFCKESFYGDDELFVHCREKHERCHICDRRTPGRPHYYLNYNTLEEHFRKDHFLCPDKECLEKKFVVFDSEMDFKAHNLEAHPDGLTKDARRVDLSDFVVRTPYSPPTRGGRGRGRGREPPAEREPLPQSSAQPLRRDELAFQRQLAIQTARQPTQAAPHRRFNGQITTESSSGSGDSSHAQPTPANVPLPSLLEVGRALPPQAGTAPTATPHSASDQLRHQSVQTRAAQLLKHDAAKIEEFQQLVSRFNRGAILAAGLVDSVASLCGIARDEAAPPEAGTLVKELAELFDESHKRDALAAAWNDRRARTEVEDYPTLPPGAPAPTTASSGWHAGARVLRLKSATAQSSRSPVARPAAWGSAAVGGGGGGSSSSINSSGPWSGAPASAARAVPAAAATTAAGGAAAKKKTAAAAVGGGARAGPASRAALADAAAFPALPAAQAPAAAGFTSFTPGAAGGRVVRRDLGRATGNAWDASAAAAAASASSGGRGSATAAEDGDGGEAGAGGGRAKKSGRKKHMLMHFG
jgi:hypothetical protein